MPTIGASAAGRNRGAVVDIFNGVLTGRADAAEEQAARRQLNKVDVVETDPAARLIKFDSWVRAELGKRLDWSWAGAQRERRIEQCRLCMEKLVLDLWRRGWMLDGKKLARHIEASNTGDAQSDPDARPVFADALHHFIAQGFARRLVSCWRRGNASRCL